MRVTGLAVLSLLAVILGALGSYSYGEPAKQQSISFSMPYGCSDGSGKTNGTQICLADPFRSGLKVVLLGEKGTCSAKTAKTFTDQPVLYEFKATRLLVNKDCLTEKEEKGFDIAVFGADPAAVRWVSLKNDKSPVPKETGLEARKLAARHLRSILKKSKPRSISVLEANPKVLRAENVTLLMFKFQVNFAEGEESPWKPMVALTDSGIFPLEGASIWEPRFLSVNDKLYLAYHASDCVGCGDVYFVVYDISSGTPQKVYVNGSFSN